MFFTHRQIYLFLSISTLLLFGIPPLFIRTEGVEEKYIADMMMWAFVWLGIIIEFPIVFLFFRTFKKIKKEDIINGKGELEINFLQKTLFAGRSLWQNIDFEEKTIFLFLSKPSHAFSDKHATANIERINIKSFCFAIVKNLLHDKCPLPLVLVFHDHNVLLDQYKLMKCLAMSFPHYMQKLIKSND